MSDSVIKIVNLNKEYKMYARKKDRLLDIIFPSGKRYGLFKAIDDFNLNIEKGEILGILGKNGAGKSTLLKMITGVVVPSSGSIEVKGKISSLLELGTAFNPELTGYENIYQHGQIMGLTNKQIEEKEQEIIDFADIGDHLNQPVKTYSSGMFARLAFACAINVDPDILIVDEVLSVGDMAFQLKCFKKFEQFKNMGKTIIFVTHGIVDIIRNCNRAIIVSDGKKIFDGDVKTGVDKYKKLIVGISPDEGETKEEEIKNENRIINNEIYEKGQVWKKHFVLNPDALNYGNKRAEIIDFGVFDENNQYLLNVNNSQTVDIKIKVKFNEDIDEPIFAMSIKDFKGLELGGVNTLAYKTLTGLYRKGEEVIVTFSQVLHLNPEKYTISFGCTKYDVNGNLEVFDRWYDAIFIELVADRECLGVIDLKSKITIENR